MGYRLQLSAEMYDWLAELRDSDSPAADPTAQPLAALAGAAGHYRQPDPRHRG